MHTHGCNARGTNECSGNAHTCTELDSILISQLQPRGPTLRRTNWSVDVAAGVNVGVGGHTTTARGVGVGIVVSRMAPEIERAFGCNSRDECAEQRERAHLYATRWYLSQNNYNLTVRSFDELDLCVHRGVLR